MTMDTSLLGGGGEPEQDWNSLIYAANPNAYAPEPQYDYSYDQQGYAPAPPEYQEPYQTPVAQYQPPESYASFYTPEAPVYEAPDFFSSGSAAADYPSSYLGPSSQPSFSYAPQAQDLWQDNTQAPWAPEVGGVQPRPMDFDSWENPTFANGNEYGETFSTITGDDIGHGGAWNGSGPVPDYYEYDEYGNLVPMSPERYAELERAQLPDPNPSRGTVVYNRDATLDPSQVEDRRYLNGAPNGAGKTILEHFGGQRLVDEDGNEIDPSFYQYFGWGSVGNADGGDFFASRNPNFKTSNAQFDNTTNPNNRDGVGFLGGAWNALGGLNDVRTELIDPALGALQDTAGDAFQNAGNYMNPYGFTPPKGSSGYTGGRNQQDNLGGDLARAFSDSQVPGSTIDLALWAGSDGAIESGIDAFKALRAGREAGALDELPIDAVRGILNRRSLENPESVGGSLARKVFQSAGASDEYDDDILRMIGALDDAAPPAGMRAIKNTPQIDLGTASKDALMAELGKLDNMANRLEQRMGSIENAGDMGSEKWKALEGLAQQNDARYSDVIDAVQRRFPDALRGSAEPSIPAAVANAADAARIIAPTTDVATGIPQISDAASSAPPLTGDVAKAGEEFAGNIRLSKYAEDVQPEIARWASQNPDVVESATRGVVSHDQTMAEARALVEDAGGSFNKLAKSWKPGDAWNASEITAARGVLNEKADAVIQAARAVMENPTDATQLDLFNAMRESARIQEAVTGATAEMGRGLNALRMDAQYLKAHPDSALVRKMVEDTGFSLDKMGDIARMLTNAEGNPAQVNSIIRSIKKPGLLDYLHEIWINSLLAGPMTHIRNFASGAATRAITPLERGVAAAVDIPLARLQGREVERFFGEAGADVAGAVKGIRPGIDEMMYVLTHDGARFGDATKIEFPHAWKGPVGSVIHAPSTALEAADALHSTIGTSAALHAEAYRQASKEGLKGAARGERVKDLLANPTEAMLKAAKTDAEYRVFRGPAGKITRGIMNVRDSWAPLKFIAPFVKTPSNLVKYGIERSPMGLLNPDLWRAVKAGSPEASDQIARAIVGSGVASAIALAVADGKITGAPPSVAAARDRFYREGKQPFSVKIGDNWVSYQQMEPFNQAFAQVYAAVDAIKTGKPVDQAVTQALTTIGTNLVSQTYMSGISDALNAIQDPERYGASWAGRLASGFLPFSSAMRTVDRAVDPKVRDVKGLKEIVQSNIPGLSDNIPSRLDALGNEVERGSPWYSPIGVTQEQIGAIDAELDRVGSEVGFVGNSVTVDGTKYSLDRSEQWVYQRAAGLVTQQYLDLLINDPRYKALEDEKKPEVIDRTVSKARTAVREDLGKVVSSEKYQQMTDKEQRALLNDLVELELKKAGIQR